MNYIDDILIFSKSFSEHINHLTQFLEAIKKGFELKFTKCTLASGSVKYLGYIIQNNSIKPVEKQFNFNKKISGSKNSEKYQAISRKNQFLP